MTIKSYALINEDNQVVNCVLIDDESDASLFDLITRANGATQWLDTETYGLTEVGGEFDGVRLWFEKPFSSWVKGEDNWVAPVDYPNDGNAYSWNEDTLEWVLVNH